MSTHLRQSSKLRSSKPPKRSSIGRPRLTPCVTWPTGWRQALDLARKNDLDGGELREFAEALFTPAQCRAVAAGQQRAARWRRDAAEQLHVVQVMEDRYDGTEASARALVEANRDLRAVQSLAATAEADALVDADGIRRARRPP